MLVRTFPKSTVYSLISHGMFPQQVSLGIRSVAFVEAEVDAWIRNKIANRNR
ncbi:transcriptional regulator [Aeromonas sp. ASNIH1]|nr:transcriptional regulator [Aeromonas sp. ASNIH1]